MVDEAPLQAAEAGLALLAGATSRDVLQAVLEDAFACRHHGWTRDRRRRLVQELGLQDDGAVQTLFVALLQLFAVALQLGPDVADAQLLLEAAFSDAFPRKLRLRIVTSVVASLAGWREAAVQGELVGQPRLLDVASGVTLLASGSGGPGAGGVGEATAWLRLLVEGTPRHSGLVTRPREINLTVDRPALAAAIASASTLAQRLAAIAEQTAAPS
jgi:hypothetical protein